MKNRWLLNIVLAVLVGALVLVAVYKPGVKKPADEGTPLTALAPDTVQHIRLARPHQPEIAFEKRGGAWFMTAPRQARANGFRLDELARLAGLRVRTRFPAQPAALGQYGLDKPVATLFLNDAEIRFGSLHPLENELYVQDGNEVALVPASLLRAAGAPLGDLLSPAPLEDKAKLVALRFPDFSLKRDAQGAWARTPEDKELTSDHVNRFVDEWRYARALSVAPYSGKPVRSRVIVTVADGDKTRDIEFGVLATKPEFVIVRRDEGLEYHFPDDLGPRLTQLKPDESDKTPPAPPTPTAR